MQKPFKVEQCSFGKTFGHIDSKCFQKSKTENKANFYQESEFSFICGSRDSKTRELNMDSGCSSHMFCDKVFCVELNDDCSRVCVNANNSLSPVGGQAVAKISLKEKQGVSNVSRLSNCLYVPEHSRNLLSVSVLTQNGVKVVFDDLCELPCSDKVSFPFERKNGLNVINTFSHCSSNFGATIKVDLNL